MPYQRYQSPKTLNLQPARAPSAKQGNSYSQGLQRLKDISDQMAQRRTQQASAQGTAAGQGAYAASRQPYGQRGPVTGPGTPVSAPRPSGQWSPPAQSTWGTGAPAPVAPQGPPPNLSAFMAQQRANQAFAPPPAQTPGQFVGGYGQTQDTLDMRRGAMGAGSSMGQGPAGAYRRF